MGDTRDETTPVRFQRVIQYVLETPWAIRPAVLGAILDLLVYRAEGGQLTAAELADRFDTGEAARRAPRQTGAVAIIPIYGSIFPRANLFTEFSGGTSLQKLSAALTEADANAQVGSIVLDIASPGGMVDLVAETAEQVRQLSKPVTAMANAEAASAAYWIASQADEVVVTPSGQVGSIGVWAAHEDWSRHDDMLGVKTTLVSAGRFKTEGNPFEPLGDEAEQAIQKMVDVYYDMFVTAVARGRGTSVTAVREGFGEGRMVTAEEAVSEGMADRVASLNQVIGELAQGHSPGKTTASIQQTASNGTSSPVDRTVEEEPSHEEPASAADPDDEATRFYEGLLKSFDS